MRVREKNPPIVTESLDQFNERHSPTEGGLGCRASWGLSEQVHEIHPA